MKLVYLAFVSPSAVGVQQKIRNQADAAASIYSSVEVVNDKNEHILLRLISRYITLFKVLLDRDGETIYYVRQQALLPFLSFFLRGKRYAYEVNAYLPAESRTFALPKRLLIRLFNDDARVLRGSILQVYISNELRVLYGHRGRHSLVVPNSIAYLPKPSGKKRDDVIKIAFVGNESQTWQGVDRLTKIMHKCQNFHFVLIGNFKSIPPMKNVEILGYVEPSKLPQVLAGCDLGISSLGFSRTGLREASPLKSRLYIECNLPHIGEYVDSEFHHFPFYKQVGDIDELSGAALSDLFYELMEKPPSIFELDSYLMLTKEVKKFKKLEEVSNESPTGW